MQLPVSFTYDVGQTTVAFGTAIKALVPPRRGLKTRVVTVRYTASTTAHVLTVMRPLARTTVFAAAAAGQTALILTIDPGTLIAPARIVAANDYLVFEGVANNGYYVYILAQVSSVSLGTVTGTLNVVLTANLPAGGLVKGALCWLMGTTSDAHPAYNLFASVTTTLQDTAVGIAGARSVYEPVVLYSNNVTATGFLENATVAYTQEQGMTTTGGLLPTEGEEQHEGVFQDMDEWDDPQIISMLCVPPDEIRSAHQTMLERHRGQPASYGHKESATHHVRESGPMCSGLAYGQVFPHPEEDEIEHWSELIGKGGKPPAAYALPAHAREDPSLAEAARLAKKELDV